MSGPALLLAGGGSKVLESAARARMRRARAAPEIAMFTYVVLTKLTSQGLKNIKESPARAQQAAEGIRKMGGKLLSMHYTQGEYDMVSVVEWPSEEVGVAFGLALEAMGNVTQQTMRAFSVDEMSDIVKKMP